MGLELLTTRPVPIGYQMLVDVTQAVYSLVQIPDVWRVTHPDEPGLRGIQPQQHLQAFVFH